MDYHACCFALLQLELGTAPLTHAPTPDQTQAPKLWNDRNTASLGRKPNSDMGRGAFLSALPPKITYNVEHVATKHAPQSSATSNAGLTFLRHATKATLIQALLLGLAFVAGLVLAHGAVSRYKLLPTTGLRGNSNGEIVCHRPYQSCVSKQQDWLQVSSCSCWDDRQQHTDGPLHLAVGVATSSNEVWLDTDTESVANTTIEVTLRDPAPQTHACNSDLHLER